MLEKKPHHKRVKRIRSDHGREFENSHFDNFFNKRDIRHGFFSRKTPQHNGLEERDNRTMQEMSRVMLKAKNVPV